MSKLSREEKIEIYERRKKGETIRDLSNIYSINHHNIQYLVRLIETHGQGILREDRNRYYSSKFKHEIINRILIGNESIYSMAIDIGLSSDGMIHNWIREYKKNGYNVIEKKRGRTSMAKAKNTKKENLTIEEELEELRKKNQYLEAENEYLKKLNVVVKQRVEREKKKKSK